MSGDFQARIAQLAARFVVRTADDRAQLSAAVDQMESAPEIARQTIRDIAHRMAGIAGIFGFDEIGVLAADIDNAARAEAIDDQLLLRSCRRLISMLEKLEA